MVKGFRQIASLTMLSRIFGMVRDMSFAYFFGAGPLMDSWAIAFKIPNLARRIFGEGAAASSLIPVYSKELERDRKSAVELGCTVVTVICAILAGIVVAGELFIWFFYKYISDYTSTELVLKLSAVMLPYMIMICVVAILAGILNSHRHFAAPAAAPVVLNVLIIGTLWISGKWVDISADKQLFVVAGGVLAAGVGQLGMQIWPLRAVGVHLRPCWAVRTEAFRKIIMLMGPMILGLTATQLNTLSDDLIAKYFSGSLEKGEYLSFFGHMVKYPLWDGAVSQLYYSQRLYQLPLGVLGISLATAIFPVMSSDAAKKDYAKLLRTISIGIRGTIFIAFPATAGLILVARPLISLLFEQGEFTRADTKSTAFTLMFYAVGLTGFFAQQIVLRAFYSLENAKMPAITAFTAVVTNIILNLTLMWFMGTGGLALSTAICSYLQVGMLVYYLYRISKMPILAKISTTVGKSFAATVLMSGIGYLILLAMSGLGSGKTMDFLRIASVVIVCGGFYALAARVMKIEMLSLVTGGKGVSDQL